MYFVVNSNINIYVYINMIVKKIFNVNAQQPKT